ncbi:hypothetical protein DSO57_1027324 [Entomophthora muscae]|uniref:Uncharacterized protein n=1 Tax=Entomophthora muscae TaxID=34485 RepID=A0ACC2SEM1_9FUNG|nr:hypothetical protein DSO57_1027324 [Entomophthora muscae]
MYCLPFSSTKGKIASCMYFIFLLFYAPHFFTIPFCYLRIVCHYSQQSRGYSVTEFDTVKRINMKLLGLLAMTLVYWTCILPHVIVFHYIFRHEPSPVLDGLAYWLKGCFLIVNPLFPILFHSEICANFCATFRSQPISFLHP